MYSLSKNAWHKTQSTTYYETMLLDDDRTVDVHSFGQHIAYQLKVKKQLCYYELYKASAKRNNVHFNPSKSNLVEFALTSWYLAIPPLTAASITPLRHMLSRLMFP